jgi:DNA-binding NarL/FixJ family response regulator
MPEVDGVEATRRIAAAHPAFQILTLTAHGDDARIRDALRAGAAGYLLKDTRADDVVRTVQARARRHHRARRGRSSRIGRCALVGRPLAAFRLSQSASAVYS